MSDCVSGLKGRAFPRLALAGLGLIFLSGCSSDVTRFNQSDSPFTNPFASNTTHAAPTSGVTTSPLAQAAPEDAYGFALEAAGGGWIGRGLDRRRRFADRRRQGETLDTISGRYGVPASALLAANGFSSASEVKSGTHLVVPVYHADGRAVASTERAAKKHDTDVADADTPKSIKKAKEKEKEKSAKADKAVQGRGEVRVKGRQRVQGRSGRRGRAVQVLGSEKTGDR